MKTAAAEGVGVGDVRLPEPLMAREELAAGMGCLAVAAVAVAPAAVVAAAVTATSEVTGIKPTVSVELSPVAVVKPTMGTVTVIEE